MFDLQIYLVSFLFLGILAVGGWGASLIHRDVSIVDRLWALMFLIVALVTAVMHEGNSWRSTVVLLLTGLWACRLSGYITYRNWGKGEDRRYQEIRRKNEPYFPLKSFYLIFLFQALLAGIIALPLHVAIMSSEPLGALEVLGIAFWAVGMFFETAGDFQLSRFKGKPENRGRVMDEGLWRYSRHPNYFGESMIWWGFYLMALGVGGWWTLISPLLMTFLLLKVSGVALLEKDMGQRHPSYRDYIQKTNAFFPGPPRRPHTRSQRGGSPI